MSLCVFPWRYLWSLQGPSGEEKGGQKGKCQVTGRPFGGLATGGQPQGENSGADGWLEATDGGKEGMGLPACCPTSTCTVKPGLSRPPTCEFKNVSYVRSTPQTRHRYNPIVPGCHAPALRSLKWCPTPSMGPCCHLSTPVSPCASSWPLGPSHTSSPLRLLIYLVSHGLCICCSLRLGTLFLPLLPRTHYTTCRS